MASRDQWLFRRGWLWTADRPADRASPLTARIPVAFSQIRRDTLSSLVAAAAQMDRIAPGALVRRFDIGRLCFAAWVEDSIAAYAWVTCGPEWVGEFERELNVQQGEAYIWDCATAPDYRRQRLFSALLGHVASELLQQGVKRLWIIGRLNAAHVVRAVEAAGFEPVMGLTYARLRNTRMLLTSPVSGASSQQVDAARRLLTGDGEQALGRLIVGNSSRPRPPETHLDR